MEVTAARLFTVREAAQFLRRSEFWVRNQIKSGALKPIETLGKPYMFTETTLKDFINGASALTANGKKEKKLNEELTVPERNKKWRL